MIVGLSETQVMEEEVENKELKSGDSLLDRTEGNSTITEDNQEKTENKKLIEHDEPLDSTCESILSSINEECKKISREKENGIEESSHESLDDDENFINAELTENKEDSKERTSNGKNSSEDSGSQKDEEEEMEFDHLQTSEENSNGNKESDETDITDYVKHNSDSSNNLQICAVDEIVSMDCSENQNDSSQPVDENGKKDNLEDQLLKSKVDIEKLESRNSDPIECQETKPVGSIKVCSSIFSNDLTNVNEKTEAEEKDVCEVPKKSDNMNSLKEKENSGGKIKLRSFASLCENDLNGPNLPVGNDPECKSDGIAPMTNLFSSEISGVAVGDIVQHSNIVESDESGVMHLKISNVVGGEDCITGLAMEDERDALLPIQISSIASLIEPLSPGISSCEKGISDSSTAYAITSLQNSNSDMQQWLIDSSKVSEGNNSTQGVNLDDLKPKSLCSPNTELSTEKDKGYQTVINIFRSPLVVTHSCEICKKRNKCEFRAVMRHLSGNKVTFICSENCKSTFITNVPKEHKVLKPRIYFERICGMCGKELTGISYSWQTREFCDKLCLADHIGEVARACFCCLSPVRVIFMVKYCVRFGSDVHQFCSNSCLEDFKSTIKVCSFCQKNLTDVNKVISPSNKEYCSNKCLKRAQRKDISQQHYKEEIDCTVCCKKMINQYEFIHNGATTWLCSDPCLNVFKYVNQVKSVNCCLCARLLNAEESCIYFFNGKKQLGLRVFCTESCFSVFVISARKIVTCEYCKVKKYNFDMICSASESSEEIYSCSVSCLNFTENQNHKAPNDMVALKSTNENDTSLSTSIGVGNSNDSTAVAPSTNGGPVMKECNMCSKVEPAQFHMVMSDSTLRSFCSYMCATRFKCTFGFQVSGGAVSLPNGKDNTELIKMKTDTMSGADDIEKEESVKAPSKVDPKAIANILSLFNPPMMNNKSTMCRPIINTKGVQCKPHQWHKEVQTEEFSGRSTILPIPIPVYVPTPMMMFSAPTPVPLIIPVPIPIPVFIPTLEKTTKELEKRIKEILEKYPSNPAEAELLLLAGKEVNDDLEVESPAVVENNYHPEELPEEETDSETELAMISRIQDTLSKFNQTYCEEKDDEKKNDNNKRKRNSNDSEAPSLKKSKYEAEHLDLSYGISVWSAWARRKILEDPEETSSDTLLLQEDLSNMSCDALCHCLILFLNDLSSQDQFKFDVDTIFYLLLGIQKHIFEQGSNFCIFLELNFENFTTAFDEMINSYYAAQNQPDPNLSRRLLGTRVTEEMLWEARQLGAHTPHVLLNTLFYFNTKVFYLKKAEDHLNLTFTQILKEWKKTKLASDVSVTMTSILKYSPVTKGNKETVAGPIYEMYENKENPLRCPVKLYEFYLSKCPESIQNDSSTYYVYPERSCQPDSPVWFSTSSLQTNTIEKMLNRVLLVREIQDSLFNDTT